MTLNLNTNPTTKKDNRMLAIGLAIAAALCLVTAAFTKHWLANGKHFQFGPLGYSTCHRPFSYDDKGAQWQCKTGSNAEFVAEVQRTIDMMEGMRSSLDDSGLSVAERQNVTFSEVSRSLGRGGGLKASGAFPITGFITMGLSILAAIGLIWSAVVALQKKRPEFKVAPTTIALLSIFVAMITGCIFVATKPGFAGMVGVSWSFWLFGAGTVAGIASAQMIAKLIRPIDPDLAAANPELYG